MTNAYPFPGFIMIEPEPKKEQDGGIYLPEDAQSKTYMAKVVAIGIEKPDEIIICKVGDRILYNKWASNEVELDGKKYQFLRANEILAVIK